MKYLFAPGCALMLYKPHLAEKAKQTSETILGVDLPDYHVCCRHKTDLCGDTALVTICTSCSIRYQQQNEDFTLLSFWQLLAETDGFSFPDYSGMKMSVQDPCMVRGDARVHKAIRSLLAKMNIEIVEAEKTLADSVCCGDSYYGSLAVEEIKQEMKKRADQMPCEDVAVYCVACLKAMHLGGRKPRYLLDLIFNEDTDPQDYEPDLWHARLTEYIEKHKA